MYLKDILEAIDQIERYTEGMDQDDFEQDDKTVGISSFSPCVRAR